MNVKTRINKPLYVVSKTTLTHKGYFVKSYFLFLRTEFFVIFDDTVVVWIPVADFIRNNIM